MLAGVLLLCLMSLRVASGITLNGNGYENIHIVIEDNVPENEELLDEIKESFTKASALLFSATRNHVYFGKCKIIVPSTWNKTDSYTPTPALSLTGSRILIGTVKNQAPHVKQIKGCGQSGEYMHLTPDFIMTRGRTDYGKREHVIVHEWGHLRWGLRDEYPKTHLKFYRKDNVWRPNRCSEKVNGYVGYGNNCVPDEKCVQSASKMADGCSFCPNFIQNFEGGASIMSYQFIDALKFFCDKADPGIPEAEVHNKDAPNEQNLVCGRKSSWEVMREHTDFKNLRQLESTFDTSPTFEIVQESNGSRVLVLDVSGSMLGERLNNMVSAAKLVIDQLLPQGSWLGIVSFSSSASVLAALRQINSDSDREYLISRLPNSVSGSTCISCGIKKGIEVLRQNTGIAENGLVILISDGQTDATDMTVSMQSAIAAEVVVHTIAVEQLADERLTGLATSTGGTHKVYLEVGEISFASVLAGTISQGITRNNENFVTIASENFIARPSAVISFTIDKDLGRSTSVTVTPKSTGNMKISLKGPDGYLQEYEDRKSTAVIKIPGVAKTGDYIVNVTFDIDVGEGQLYVVSFPTTGDGVVRLITALENNTFDFESKSLPIIYTAIDKNSNSILDVNVTAKIEYGDSSCNVVLMDNGLDPDVVADDGTYSSYIGIKCLGSGRMSIQTSAKAANGTARLMTGFATAYSPESVVQYEILQDTFQRVSASEELTVINYAPDDKDTVVPGKVSDLAIQSVDRLQLPYGEVRNVTIQWTPTGDDKSYGLASSYDIRMSTDMDELLDDVSFVSAESIALYNASGSTLMEEYQFSLTVNDSSSMSLYIALKAIDEVGNIGPISNIVLFGPRDDVFLNITNEEHRTSEKESSDIVTVVTVTVIIAVLCLCIVGSIIAYRIYHKRNAVQEHDVQPTLNKGFDDTMDQI